MEARGFASRTHEFITVVLAALIGAGPLYGQSGLTQQSTDAGCAGRDLSASSN